MAITVATSNSVKKAFAPLGSAFDNSYAEIVTVLGSTSADEEPSMHEWLNFILDSIDLLTPAL